MKKIIASFLAFVFSPILFAQISVNNSAPYNSPSYLVNNILLGQGVTASNITFTGNSNQIGYFNTTGGTDTLLGIGSGIIISSGDIQTAVGPNNNGSITIPTGGYNNPGDSDLDAIISPISTNDAAVLEFDFIPSGDTIRFKYTFGSEEYMEYVGGGINDVFAFFLSGVTTSFPTTNIALIPGTSTPVSIDNINANTNSSYYVDNGTGSSSPQNTNASYVQYDGYTVTLEAVAVVECNETYHIKIAIADGSDAIIDSGVFLEAESFGSSDISISLSTGTTSLDSDSTIVEGCTQAVFTFARPDTTDTLVIHYTSSGNAIEGLDFDSIPDSLVFYPGIDSISLVINPIADTLIEDQDTIRLSIIKLTPCGDTIYINGVVYILGDYQVRIPTDSLTLFCPGDSIPLIAVGENGIPEFDYTWQNGSKNDTLWVTPSISQFYSITMTDSCKLSLDMDSFFVEVPVFEPLAISSNDTSTICKGDTVIIGVMPSGGGSTYFYNWNPIATDTNMITVSPLTTSTYNVSVTDQCNNIIDTNIVVSVPQPLPLQINPTTDGELVCSGDGLVLIANIEGGSGFGNSYAWGHNSAIIDNSTAVIIVSDSIFSVSVTDGCDNVATTNFNIILPIYDEVVAISDTEQLLCQGDSLLLSGTATGGAGDYSYIWTGNGTIESPILNETKVIPIDESGYSFIVTDQCGKKDTVLINVTFDNCKVESPIVFTPNGDNMNQYLQFKNLEKFPNSHLVIYNRFGRKVYEADNYENNWDGDNKTEGVYFYILYLSSGEEINGFFHLLK